MNNDLIPVEGYRGLARDPVSNAIINKDNEGHKSAIENHKRMKAEKEELDNLKKDVSEIKNMLKQLLGNK